MKIEHVEGKDSGKVMLYALSTCPWCRKTKELLNKMGVSYDYIDVDHLDGKEREDTLDAVRKWNPSCSFPTLVINDNKCIVGFVENDIKQALTK
jgi:glutaredoxin-like protein NrdH